MRSGTTTNGRTFHIQGVADSQAEWETVPAKPYGALVVHGAEDKPESFGSTFRTALLAAGGAGIILAGRRRPVRPLQR